LLADEHPFELRVLPQQLDPSLWTHWTLARAANEVDLLFCPSYVAPLTYRRRFVVTIHDALPALMPAANPSLRRRARVAAVRRTARRATAIVTPSESSKRDVERLYRIPAGRVRAIPLGVDQDFRQPVPPEVARALRERYRLGGDPFVLFVGKLARRRNLPMLVEAFADARRRLATPHRLVLAGADPLGIAPSLTALAPDDALRLAGHVSEDDLRALFHEAEAFVYPSAYEGFGLPVLEAMAAGTPVLTIANSSLAEVAGDAALLLPEATRESLAVTLAQLLADPARRHELTKRGRARAALFSWRRTAQETLAVLEEAVA
jgi:glycosyltransferase involved in cell wall biosynthesis